MAASLQMPGGVIDAMGPQIQSGVQVHLSAAKSLTVPAFPAVPTYHYAKVAQ